MEQLKLALYEDNIGIAGRDQAIRDGKKLYFGKCHKGHVPIRYSSNDICRQCLKNSKSKKVYSGSSRMVDIDRAIQDQLDQKELDAIYEY